MKGSPEKILSRCDQSKLPQSYISEMENIASEGLRLIALAYRPLDPKEFNIEDPPDRDTLEKDMIFLGFIIFENKLKPTTKDCISELVEGNIKCMIATGDNGRTASSVALKCGVIKTKSYYKIELDDSDPQEKKLKCELARSREPSVPSSNNQDVELGDDHVDTDEEDENAPFVRNEPQSDIENQDHENALDSLMTSVSPVNICINGPAFDYLIGDEGENLIEDKYSKEEVLEKVLKDGKVFSRMSPKQKAGLISKIQSNGGVVGMCGDGANDCTALKTADIGLSLSEAEASIAAPFTSKAQDISSVITLLKQGRAALDLSTTLFKFVILVSATQLSSMIILYYSTSNLDDLQYGYIGLALVSPIIIMICFMDTSTRLVPELPYQSLIHWAIIMSIIGQSLINIGVQIGGYFAMRGEGYFTVAPEEDDYTTDGFESTAVFLTSTPQYVFIGVVFSIFTKFRTPIYRSVIFMLIVLGQLAVTYWIILHPAKFMRDDLELRELDSDFRWFIAMITVGNGILCFAYEFLIYLIYNHYKDKAMKNEELPNTL